MKEKKAIVIGAGIAGIAAAIRLQHLGYQVSVYDSNEKPGGKLTEFIHNGFRFDAGPSLFTMPQYVIELFELFQKDYKAHFDFEQLPVVCKYFYEDGTRLNAYADIRKFTHELKDKLGESEAKIKRFFHKAKELYQITNPVFLNKSLHKRATYLNWETFKSLLQVYKLDVFRSMHQANQQLFSNPKTVQLFDRYATYNGSNPYEAPATLNIISHLEHEIGAFFPKDGMYSITQSLFALAKEVGVHFHFNETITEIVVDQQLVKGIKLKQEFVPANLVVSNVDVVNTYRKLLPKSKHPEKLLNQPKSSSALIFYWGMNEEFPELDLHNIFFSENYEEEFNCLFQQQTIYEDPTVYVFISAKQVPADAPQGAENWFVMINTPNDAGQDWEQLIATARANIIKKLERVLNRPIQKHILFEKILDPKLIELRTASSQGALYGNSSNNRYAAFLRHPNFSKQFENLYFCGGSVHPGGGIPLCLLSAKIVGDLVGSK
ncbi:MAG: 1-hydroxycarotenoid 3,4-desaturase CrtD [Flammeovirgaceae bacterium]